MGREESRTGAASISAWLSQEESLKAPIYSKTRELAGSENLDGHLSLLAGDIVRVQ